MGRGRAKATPIAGPINSGGTSIAMEGTSFLEGSQRGTLDPPAGARGASRRATAGAQRPQARRSAHRTR